MKSLLLLGIFGILTLSGNWASAVTLKEFKSLVKKEQSHCPNLRCLNSEIRVKNLTLRERDRLDPVVYSRLHSAAKYLSQSWADGILEGNFSLDEYVNLDHVEKVIYAGEIIGFRITYSSRAWDMDQCHNPSRSKDPIKRNCLEGRIIESGFVTLNLRYTFHDEMSPALFSE